MKKIAISVFVLLALALVSCADSVDTTDVLAARKAAVSDITWNDSYIEKAIDITPYKSERNNASGKGVVKITSNAHSADCKDVYFRWDSKQKDNAYLLVKASLFETYESFLLTTKVSNTYWDYVINLDAAEGAEIVDGLYVFSVPKGKAYQYFDKVGDVEPVTVDENKGCGKNINMVFLSNFKEINSGMSEVYGDVDVKEKYVVTFKKVIEDARFDGGVLPLELWIDDLDKFSFTVTYLGTEGKFSETAMLCAKTQTFSMKVPYDGAYEITETIKDTNKYESGRKLQVEPTTATKTIKIVSDAGSGEKPAVVVSDVKLDGLGDDLYKVWKGQIAGKGYDLGKLGDAKFIWDRADSWAYGLTGSVIIQYSSSFNLTQKELDAIDGPFEVSFAADNAAVMLVNNKVVEYTKFALSPESIAKIEAEKEAGGFGGFISLSSKGFDDQEWQHIYTVDIKDSLKAGDNKIVFYAANSAYDADDEVNSQLNMTNNPCGLIFYGEKTISTAIPGTEYVFKNKKQNSGKGGNGTVGIPEASAAESELSHANGSGFTFADLTLLTSEKWLAYPVWDNAQKGIVGTVFMQRVGDKVNVVIDCVKTNYAWKTLSKVTSDDNLNKGTTSGSWNGESFSVDYDKYFGMAINGVSNWYNFE